MSAIAARRAQQALQNKAKESANVEQDIPTSTSISDTVRDTVDSSTVTSNLSHERIPATESGREETADVSGNVSDSEDEDQYVMYEIESSCI